MTGKRKNENETVQKLQKAPEPGKKAAAQQPCRYKIVCCQTVSKQIGGLSFQNGVAYTEDAYTASWFGNKAGYTVSKE